jgi:hypothetical protein
MSCTIPTRVPNSKNMRESGSEMEGVQHRAYEKRVEIAAWLAAFFSFVAALGSVAYFR